jgi:dynein heavy chain
LAFLGPDLKAVTGSSERIDREIDNVKEVAAKLENFPFDIFDQEKEETWKERYAIFENGFDAGVRATRDLIKQTFDKNLSSAEGAFDLLNKFKNIKTREEIKSEL